MSKPNRRPSLLKRRLLVVPKTQFVVLAYSLYVSLISIGITALINKAIEHLRNDSAGTGSTVLVAILMLAVASISLVIYLGLHISQRIVGPVFHLGSHMRDVNSGAPLQRIRFRKHDHFADIAGEYNKVLERLAKAEGTTLGD